METRGLALLHVFLSDECVFASWLFVKRLHATNFGERQTGHPGWSND